MPVVFKKAGVQVDAAAIAPPVVPLPQEDPPWKVGGETALQCLAQKLYAKAKAGLMLMKKGKKSGYLVETVEELPPYGYRIKLRSEETGVHFWTRFGTREDQLYDPVWR